MKKPIVAFGLSLLVQALLGQAAPSPATGLWQVSQETDEGVGTAFLLIPPKPQAPILYDSRWEKQILYSVDMDEDRFNVNFQLFSGNLLLEGKREGDQAKGVWHFYLPQYADNAPSGSFSARRVFDVHEWDPFQAIDALGQASEPVDLCQYLVRKAPHTEKEFLSFWNESFLPDFFVFARIAPSPQKVFSVVSGEGFERAAKNSSSALEAFSRRFAEEFPKTSLHGQPVLLPFGNGKIQVMDTSPRRFILIDALAFSDAATKPAAKAKFYRQVLEAAITPLLPSGNQLEIQLYREGLPSYFAAKLLGEEALPDVLAVSKSELKKIEAHRDTLMEGKGTAWIKGSVRRYVSYDFAKTLAKEYSGKLLDLRFRELHSEFAKYMTQAKAEASSASP